MDRRIGTFTVTSKIIDTQPDTARTLFSGLEFVPLRVSCAHWNGYYEFTGYSPKFERITLGMPAPTYILIMEVDEDGVETFKEATKV